MNRGSDLSLFLSSLLFFSPLFSFLLFSVFSSLLFRSSSRFALFSFLATAKREENLFTRVTPSVAWQWVWRVRSRPVDRQRRLHGVTSASYWYAHRYTKRSIKGTRARIRLMANLAFSLNSSRFRMSLLAAPVRSTIGPSRHVRQKWYLRWPFFAPGPRHGMHIASMRVRETTCSGNLVTILFT